MDEREPTPDPTVVVADGAADPSTAPWCEQVRALLGDGAARVVCVVAAVAHPSVAVLDALARMQLTARGSGSEVRLRGAPEELRALLDLCGLADVLPSDGEPEQLDE